MKYDDEYYVLAQGNVASLEMDPEKSKCKNSIFNRGKHVEFEGLIHAYVYCYGEDPKEEKFNIGNFFIDPNPTMVEELKNVLQTFDLFKTQYFPLEIGHLDQLWTGFTMMHNHNYLPALHKTRSKYDTDDNRLYFVDSVSLDEDVLDKIPEEERLIFRLKERSTMYFVHQKVVDAIEASGVDGMGFCKVKHWGIGSAFD